MPACQRQGTEAQCAPAAAPATSGRPSRRGSRGQVKLPRSTPLQRLRGNFTSRAAPDFSRAFAPTLSPPNLGSKPRSPPVPQRHPRPPPAPVSCERAERRWHRRLRSQPEQPRREPDNPRGGDRGEGHGPAAPSHLPPGSAPRSYPARGASRRSSVRVISFVL